MIRGANRNSFMYALENGFTNRQVPIVHSNPYAIQHTVDKLNELSSLKDNWDSYGALAPSKQALIGTMQLINDLFTGSTPSPDVFPVANGSIQLEWSMHNMDIEIEIVKNNLIRVCYEELATGEDFEREFSYDLTELAAIIDDLSDRHSQAPLAPIN